MIKSLKIGGAVYEVKSEDLGRVSAGLCDVDRRIISIDNTKGYSQTKQEMLFHEAIHAIMTEYGLVFGMSENEEEFRVRVLTSAMLSLFMQNKQFGRDFIKHCLESGK